MPATGQQLVGDDAEREQIGAAIERPGEVLGRDVGHLALDQAGLGLGAAVALDDAEADQLRDALVVDDDVRQRHVAVHEIEGHAVVVAHAVDVLDAGRLRRDAVMTIIDASAGAALAIIDLEGLVGMPIDSVPASVLSRQETAP